MQALRLLLAELALLLTFPALALLMLAAGVVAQRLLTLLRVALAVAVLAEQGAQMEPQGPPTLAVAEAAVAAQHSREPVVQAVQALL